MIYCLGYTRSVTALSNPPALPKIFLDADVLFAGAASPSTHGASFILLAMGQLTLLQCITSEQAINEAERNLIAKLPTTVASFRLLVRHCVHVVPTPSAVECAAYTGEADPKDLPILVAALREHCPYLITFNTRHFFPQSAQILVQRPGSFMQTLRGALSTLA